MAIFITSLYSPIFVLSALPIIASLLLHAALYIPRRVAASLARRHCTSLNSLLCAAQGDITYATVASPPNPSTGTLLQGSGSCKNHDSRIINISNSASRRCPFFQPSGKLPPNHRQTHSAVIGKQTNDGLGKEASFSMALSVNCKEPVALNVNFWIMISLSGFLYVSVNSTTSCVVFSRCFFMIQPRFGAVKCWVQFRIIKSSEKITAKTRSLERSWDVVCELAGRFPLLFLSAHFDVIWAKKLTPCFCFHLLSFLFTG